MSDREWGQRIHEDSDALKAAEGAEADGACPSNDLKGLLNAIVSQISEADRRQTTTLSQMQERLSHLGKDAKSLRERVPDQFQAAFERIEYGMADLAARISEAVVQQPHVPDFTQPAHAGNVVEFPAAPVAEALAQYDEPVPAPPQAAQQPVQSFEPPVALRSAQPVAAIRNEPAPVKAPADFDTFDVIESLPGDVTAPWDHESADALADLYQPDTASHVADPYGHANSEPSRLYAAVPATAAPTQPGLPVAVDQTWFEKRFTEIAERLDASLADIRPDQSFFALGQRLDQFERNFAQALDNVATRKDVESVHLIEANLGELVSHLENTAAQLERIDHLETQMASLADRLNELHQLANESMGTGYPPNADVAAVARAAAQEAASHFASLSPAAVPAHGIAEMHALLERSMRDARHSEENTSALLDTLQQAMIRLLDRMDTIEFNQLQQANAVAGVAPDHTAVHADKLSHVYDFDQDEPQAFGIRGRDVHQARREALEEAIPGLKELAEPAFKNADRIAENEHGDSEPAPSDTAPRAADKLRQDFIADARRAKMRLAAEKDASDVVVPMPSPAPAAAGKSAEKGARAAVAATAGMSLKQQISPRVIALSVALLLAGGAYFFMSSRSAQKLPAAPVAQSGAQTGNAEAVQAPMQRAPTKSVDATPPAALTAPRGEAPPPDADFSKPADGKAAPQLNMQESTHGEIVPDDITVGSTSVPMNGVSVATDANITAEEWARARRQHAMATVSTKLGQAASDQPATNVVRTALAPYATGAAQAQSAEQNSIASNPMLGKASPLDLPPATVGPLSLRLAAANGDPSAQFEVGARLAEGKGTDQNFKEAAKWYQRSASQGFVQAQYRLGTLFERGLGMKADEARAKDWYLRAAEQGNIKAMHNLAVLNANSHNGTPDYASASKWFTEAAQRGLPDSQFNLAVLYENGLGVTPDARESYKWLSLSARAGDKEAIRRRDIMRGKLTAEELAEADAMVKSFQVKASDPLANDARRAGEAWKANATPGDNG